MSINVLCGTTSYHSVGRGVHSAHMLITLVFPLIVTVEGQKPLDDPDMLIQQQIPKSYIDLQCRLALKASHMKLNKMAPIMTRDEF